MTRHIIFTTLAFSLAVISVAQSQEQSPAYTNASNLWRGDVGIVEHSSTASFQSGDMVERDAIIQVNFTYSRTASLDEEFHLKPRHGKGIFIPKGSFLYAANLPVIDKKSQVVTVEEEIEWCLVRNKDSDGEPIKPKTYCIVRADTDKTLLVEPVWDYVYTPEVLFTVRGKEAPMPVFSEKLAKTDRPIIKQLEVSDISKKGFKLQWTIRDNDDKNPRRRSDLTYKYEWKDRTEIEISNDFGKFTVEKIDKKNIKVTWIDQIQPEDKLITKYREVLNFEKY